MVLDKVRIYRQSGAAEDHYIDPEISNEGKLKLFARLLGGEVCGMSLPDMKLTLFVKCGGNLETDGMNDAASNLSGVLVSGDAILVPVDVMERWNNEKGGTDKIR
jgi:hypothetical protein